MIFSKTLVTLAFIIRSDSISAVMLAPLTVRSWIRSLSFVLAASYTSSSPQERRELRIFSIAAGGHWVCFGWVDRAFLAAVTTMSASDHSR